MFWNEYDGRSLFVTKNFNYCHGKNRKNAVSSQLFSTFISLIFLLYIFRAMVVIVKSLDGDNIEGFEELKRFKNKRRSRTTTNDTLIEYDMIKGGDTAKSIRASSIIGITSKRSILCVFGYTEM